MAKHWIYRMSFWLYEEVKQKSKKIFVCNHLIRPRERKRRKISEKDVKIRSEKRLYWIIILVSKSRLMHVTLSLLTDTETNKTKSKEWIKRTTYLLTHIFTFCRYSFGETQHGATAFLALFAKDFICQAHTAKQQMTRHLRMTTDLLSLERDVKCIPCDIIMGVLFILEQQNKTRMSLLFSMFSIGSTRLGSFTYSISSECIPPSPPLSSY